MVTQEENKPQKTLKQLLKTVIILPILFFSIIIFMYFYLTDTYYIFTSKRIDKMEQYFGITVTDNIKLKKYQCTKGWQDPNVYKLYIENISDYSVFMNDNVHGKIVEATEDQRK